MSRRIVAASPINSFAEVMELIDVARGRVFQAVNTVLIELYWRIGQIISRKLESAEWGEGIVDELAAHIARSYPGLRGFTRRNLYRMRQFHDAYPDAAIVPALLTQLPWTHHLIILGQSRRSEEREFYIRRSIIEGWTSRQLERQVKLALFEQAATRPAFVSAALAQTQPRASEVFRHVYVLEFLNLPDMHSEADLHLGLVSQLKDFLIELGRDFCFAGSQFPLQVGGRDFALDLLFFHRALNALVAIELKVGRFEPEHLGKLGFYLEALDRDVRKPHENPAIGLLLCASKDDEVVEYALSRTLSPALVAQYRTQLPDRELLRAKLQEFYRLSVSGEKAE